MIKRIIFDVDNTLIIGINFNVPMEKALRELNIYSEENLENFSKGIATYESIYNNYNRNDYKKHMEKCMNMSMPDNYLDVFFNYLKDAISENNDELISIIDNLSNKYELVLLTNYFSASQLSRLNNMGIGKYFTEVYGETLIKPNKGAYIMACGSNKPEECLMVGDSIPLDIEPARKEGLKTIFVNTKMIPTDNLDFVTVNKVEEITEEILNSL